MKVLLTVLFGFGVVTLLFCVTCLPALGRTWYLKKYKNPKEEKC